MKRIFSLVLTLMVVLSLALPAHAALINPPLLFSADYLGGCYSGSMQNNKASGKGTLTWEECRYVGDFKNGYPYGTGTFYYKDGTFITGTNWNWSVDTYASWVSDRKGADMYYTGLVLNNEYCGYGLLEFNAGGSFQGEFVDNEPCGWGIYTYRNPSSDKNKTKESDDWVTVHNNSRLEHKYTGLKIGSKWQGFGIGIKKSGYCYCGEILNDYRDGHGELYTKSDKLEQWGIYRKGSIKTRYKLP